MKKGKLSIILILIFTIVSLLIGCTNGNQEQSQPKEEPQKLEPIKVMLDWVPNTNHTGLYVAKEKGWYKEQGLDVEIVQPPEGGTAQLIGAGQAQFGISYQEEVTYARSGPKEKQLPVVSIAAIIQHNTSGFASPKEKNITTPKDFEGKKYGGWGSPSEKAIIESIMVKENADVNKVEFVNVGAADFFTVTKRDVDFEWIYYGWTGVEAELRNFPINYIELRKLAPELDFYTPVIITNEKYIKDHPDTIKKFMEATTKGYEFAIQNPDEAANILLNQVSGLNADLVTKSQEWLSKKYQEDAEQWGIQKESVWNNYSKWMVDHQLIPEMIEVNKVYTNEFLPKR
ncbi:ABC transporter substrate-binding protein [Tepidibacillus infernus]|uniref:ABC transporter substrate-binding protein n=1 Tax=Tepidibacillus decaturensis TaxID=1413211 RepID=A0A135L0P2_9BACI|nr:ABC transporter substrate-binding protein [Tepidibacillus decaturensis]KXG42519.1 ABC transporter substrate-binding protein [Tepidibacillus decaturensis]